MLNLNMSNMLTIQQVADELGISTKTLRRWEEKGFFAVPDERDPKTNVRLYHPYYVAYWKRVLNLDRALKNHLDLLDGLRKELDKHMLEQDYKPGQPLKFLDIESFTKAYDDMQDWEKDYRRLLDEIMKFPKSILKATIDKYDEEK